MTYDFTFESIQADYNSLIKEDILSEDFIDAVFETDDELEREQLIVRIACRAKELGCKGDFMRLIKAQRQRLKALRKELSLQSQLQPEPEDGTYSFIPTGTDTVINFRTGQWHVSDNGIVSTKGKRIVIASHYPVVISKRMTNLETGTVKLEVTWWQGKQRKSYMADRGTFASRQKIVSLSDYDFPVSSETAAAMVSYLTDFESMNLDNIPHELSSSKFGWQGNEFVPYTDNIVFDGGIPSRALVGAVMEQGSYDAWLNIVRQIRQNGRKEPLVYLSASFGSPLLPLLGIQSFFVNIFGTTGKGKTVNLMMAASVWANPANDGGYLTESTGTINALEQKQGILCNLPLTVDDLSKIQQGNKRLTISGLIYRLCAGNGKDRLTRSIQLRQTATWCNIILTNMERPLADDGMQGGAINRVLDFEIEDGNIFQDGNAVVTALAANYGHAGKRFIEAVKRIGKDGIRAMVDGYQDTIRTAATAAGVMKEEKQIIPLAVLLTADEISEQELFHDGIRLDIDYCISMLKSVNEVSEEGRAYQYLMDDIQIHDARFYPDTYGDCWGTHYNEYYIAIIPKVVKDIFAEANFSVKTFINWADKLGLLISDNDTAHAHQKRVSIGNKRSWAYVIRLDYEPSQMASATDITLEDIPFEMPS